MEGTIKKEDLFMKSHFHIAFLALTLTAVILSGCSQIKIINPQANQSINMPCELVVAHTGCGTALENSLRAHLDTADISASFIYDRSRQQWKSMQYRMPLGNHSLAVSADVNPGAWCVRGSGTDSQEFTVASSCPTESYCAYFSSHPKIAGATINTFDQETSSYFWAYIFELENRGVITIEEPEASRNCNEGEFCLSIELTDVELKRILAAKTAHAVWLDKNRMLAWQLNDYTEDELKGLFDRTYLFYDSNKFYSVVDYSPSDVYRYVTENNLIGGDIFSTLYLVLEDLRTTDSKIGFVHGIRAYDGDLVDTAYTLYNALTVCSQREYSCVRIARAGCGSMTNIIIGVLRSMNIPGEWMLTGEWNNLSAIFPALQLALPHGDDIYNASLAATPTEELLTPFSFYEDSANIEICGRDRYQLSQRYRVLLAINYPANWTLNRCCNSTDYGFSSCEDYLQINYGAYLTPEELSNAVTTITSLCQ
jgi:hypothetical protein